MTSSSPIDRTYVERAVTLLERASGLRTQVVQEELKRARALFSDVEEIVHRHANEVHDEATQLAARYDGLPVRVNPFDVFGIMENELAHSSFLRWLLDPQGSHGLGDMILRRFLARGVGPVGLAMATGDAPLQAVAVNEVELEGSRIDIMVAARNLVAGIEVKVLATESGDKERAQTRVYRRLLADPDVRARALARMGPRATELAGPRPAVLMFFVRRRGAGPAKDGPATKSLDWLDIEQDLAQAVRRTKPVAEAEVLLHAFRSTLLLGSGSTNPMMPRIVALRRLVDMPARARANPLQTLLQIRAITTSNDWEGDNE